MDECKHSSKASGATTAGALMRPDGGNFTHLRIKILCRPARTPSAARRRRAQRRHHGARGDYDLHGQLIVATSLPLQRQTPTMDQAPQTMLPRAPLCPRRANQDRRGQYPSHTLEGLSLCRANAHLYTLGHPLREEEGDFILFANEHYKGLPARSRREVQTHCHLRGNFSCLVEERC